MKLIVFSSYPTCTFHLPLLLLPSSQPPILILNQHSSLSTPSPSSPQAAESINKITILLPPSDIETHFLPLLKRLASGDWFTSRTSACALFAAGYETAKGNENVKTEMRRMFADLCADDTPMVRRAAAKSLGVGF